jgi:hypothetical protein
VAAEASSRTSAEWEDFAGMTAVQAAKHGQLERRARGTTERTCPSPVEGGYRCRHMAIRSKLD